MSPHSIHSELMGVIQHKVSIRPASKIFGVHSQHIKDHISKFESIQQNTGLPETSTFLRANSIYSITKRARKYCIPILIVFKYQMSQYTIYLFNCVLGFLLLFPIYSYVVKCVPDSVFSFFQNLHFSFFTS